MNYKGTFTFEQVRNGVIIAQERFENLSVDEGVAKLFDVSFGGSAASNPWYIGLINNSPTPTLLTTDTLAAHSGWTEFTGYTGNRQEWVDAATALRIKGTTSVAAFPITSAVSLYGMFICNAATGNVGTIWAEGAFDAIKPVVATDTINASYDVEMS